MDKEMIFDIASLYHEKLAVVYQSLKEFKAEHGERNIIKVHLGIGFTTRITQPKLLGQPLEYVDKPIYTCIIEYQREKPE